MTTSFSGQMKSSLVMQRPLANIDTFEELLNSTVEIIIDPSELKWFERYLDTRVNAIRTRLVYSSLNDFENQIRDKRSSAHLLDGHEIAQYIIQMTDSMTGRPIYHEMREKLAAFGMVCVTEMGSPFRHRINELLGLFHQSGLFVHWMMEDSFEFILANRNDTRLKEEWEDEANRVVIVMTMEHLQTAFYLWAGGLVVSAAVLICERQLDGGESSRKRQRGGKI